MSGFLRIGFVPEHFSTPLHFAQKHYALPDSLVPFPSGTGHMVQALRAGEIDVGVGLTEGWVAALGKAQASKNPSPSDAGFKVVGTYVETPLCWAISTGVKRELSSVKELYGRRIGVSRIGSGSYVMGFVLADQQGWLDPSSSPQPFEVVPLNTFERLREGVNNSTADFFMWEHFTSKRYYDNESIKRIGEIYTPWSSWKIVARTPLLSSPELQNFLESVNKGIRYFEANQEEAVKYISTELDYSEKDARDWLKTVRFAQNVTGVDKGVIEKTVEVLSKAGVLGSGVEVESMIGVERSEAVKWI
ncbi:periplasmic binding protein-like II [Glonium stellatum]|uniref:Periplasmic binding protein-like II n=1 Tax=Glonium stellatum TaxID=574774 RepID=A0A8E2JY95_9PEZI|nr:periplasmic binding protein-like II [Glonium stellatum]